MAAAINQSSIRAIIEESGHTIETMEHGINRILNRSFRQSVASLRGPEPNGPLQNVTSSLVSPKNRLLVAGSTSDAPIQSENLTNQGDASFAEQINETGEDSTLAVDKATTEVFHFEWNTESPLTSQPSCVDKSRVDMGLQHLTSFYEGSHTQRPPQKTDDEGHTSMMCEEPEFGGDPLPHTEKDRNLITSSRAMEDKTLLQSTSHLLETLEDKGIWRILEDSLKRDEGSLSSFVGQSTMTAPSKEFDNKGGVAIEDVKVKREGADWSSLQRFAFYQAGKAILQTELPLHPSASFLPLEPQVFHQSTSDLSRLLSPEGAFEPQRRVMLETRLIGIYAGKAGELLGLSSQELRETTQKDVPSSLSLRGAPPNQKESVDKTNDPTIAEKEQQQAQIKETQPTNSLPVINVIDDDLSHSGQSKSDLTSPNATLATIFNGRRAPSHTSSLYRQSETTYTQSWVEMSEGMLKKGLTLQSDLGVEELSFAGLMANHMINTWYLYSKKIASQKFNLAHVSQDENEIEIDDPVLLDIFRHLEKAIEDETRLARRTSFMYQHRFAPAWWQTQLMTEESLVEPNDSDWYRLYIPDPEETERNIDWVAPDDHYHAISANLLKNTSRTGIPSHFVKRTHNLRTQELFGGTRHSTGSAVTWNDLYLINRDYIYQALISNCLHKAINLLDKRRELLDLFADQLLRYNLLRQHEIGTICKQFNVVSSSPRLLASIAENSQEGVAPVDVTSPLFFQGMQKKAAVEDASTQPQDKPANPGPFSKQKDRKEASRADKGSQQTSTSRKTKRVRWGSYSRRETARFVDFDFVKPCFFKRQGAATKTSVLKEKQGEVTKTSVLGEKKESPSGEE